MLRVQQQAVEREHEIAEDFRLKLSNINQNINKTKQSYEDRVSNLNREHKQTIEKLREEHQSEIDAIKSELHRTFDIENEAQTKYYLQTIEDLKREHQDLLLQRRNQEMTQDELGQEYLKQKVQLEKQIQLFQDQIEQMKVKSELELNEQKDALESKINEYKQLENEFEQYKLVFNANSNDLSELNQQVNEHK